MIRFHRPPHLVTPALVSVAFAIVLSSALPARGAGEGTTTTPGQVRPGYDRAALEALARQPATAAPAEAAIVAPAPAVARTPAKRTDEIFGLINLGASLTERGDFEAAEIAYRQVLNANQVSVDDTKTALLGLARMHRRKGEYTKATAIYELYLKEYPGDEHAPEALLDLGRSLRDLGAYKMARARFYSILTSTLKLPGESFDRYQVLAKTAKFEIAETHFQAGEFAEANKHYTQLRLVELAPEDRARAHFKGAYSLLLQGDREGAVKALRTFVEQYPGDQNIPEARYRLAVALRELNRPNEALATTLELLRTEKARTANNPKLWAHWQRKTGNQLANEFFENGDTLNARAIYASLLELSPEPQWRLPITYQLGLCYERLGIIDRARFSYQTIVDAAGQNPPEDLAELARMAAWRIEHLEWRDRVGRQLSTFFESTTGRQIASTPAAAKPAATP